MRSHHTTTRRHSMTTRKWLGALMALGCTLATAQEPFPSRPLTLINPWAAGSSTDVMARTLAEEFRKQLGQSVVVVSRDGGSGVIGMNVLAQAPADEIGRASCRERV